MTVAEALQPLYQSYLRRLDEMAARLPAEAILSERTTRGDDGRLVLGEGGLPLRFDVADARDGHTYEVHGAHPDAPAAGSARVSEIEVHLEPGNWEELSVSCGFDGEPSPEDAEELADVLRGFAIIGWYGAFTGPGGSDQARWSGKVHSMRMHLAPGELRAVYDMGSCPPGAVEMLCGALAGYSRERVPLAWVRIGGRAA